MTSMDSLVKSETLKETVYGLLSFRYKAGFDSSRGSIQMEDI